jgi:CubicO group peptidase (beta-lactamase class C family)
MKSLVALALFFVSSTIAWAAELPRSTPEAQGIDSAAILAFVEAADTKLDSLHSMMLVRHGQVVAEGWWTPYNRASRHSLFSLSKSFTSTAVGIAIAEGKLSVDDPVTKFFPDDLPAEQSANLKSMRVSDLLRMSTGQQTEPPRVIDHVWTKDFLAHPVPFKPGTHFLYNTSATYMCSAIVQQATGQTLLDYLGPRLFGPLGIENPTWEASSQGISTGGYGLSIRTEDIARFGQLYLQRGKWEGKQLVPAEWIDKATARQTSNGSDPNSDWAQGYGYQFWRCRHGAYRGDGAFGQFCVVFPEQDAVLAVTSGLRDMQAVLNLTWEHLLPAMNPSALSANDAGAKQLRTKLNILSLRPASGTGAPVDWLGRRFTFAKNDAELETIQLDRDAASGKLQLVARVAGAEQHIACGEGNWASGRFAWGKIAEQPVAASGAWTGDNTFTAKLCFYETPTTITLKLSAANGELQCVAQPNVGFGLPKEYKLTGKAE